MIILSFLIFACLFCTLQNLTACPTCIGDVNHKTPVFFSDDFYRAQTINEENENSDTDESNKNDDNEYEDNNEDDEHHYNYNMNTDYDY